MSKLKIIFNFNDTPEKEPVELGELLQVQKNQDDIFNMRCLYLLRPNMENELTKLGIAGENGSTGGHMGDLGNTFWSMGWRNLDFRAMV